MATGVKKNPGLWDCGMAFDIQVQNVLEKNPGLPDCGVATGVTKTRSNRPRCGHWSY